MLANVDLSEEGLFHSFAFRNCAEHTHKYVDLNSRVM